MPTSASTTIALPPDLQVRRFEDVPAARQVRVFGVTYARVPDGHGGDLYVTRHGWPVLGYLFPEVWYDHDQYHRKGNRLEGSTGTVYRMRCSPPGLPRAELVIKFSRFAEYVPLFLPSTLSRDVPRHLRDGARFNSPFEEFGLVEDLRRGRFGPPDLRIRTKRPLAIYCPSKRHPLWRLGRSHSRFAMHARALAGNQSALPGAEKVELDITRQYVLLFGWVRGENAEELARRGVLSEAEVERLSERVCRELAAKGFRILDNKPKHFIVRVGRDGQPVRRRGELLYVQVDFELLQRTEEYAQAGSGRR